MVCVKAIGWIKLLREVADAGASGVRSAIEVFPHTPDWVNAKFCAAKPNVAKNIFVAIVDDTERSTRAKSRRIRASASLSALRAIGAAIAKHILSIVNAKKLMPGFESVRLRPRGSVRNQVRNVNSISRKPLRLLGNPMLLGVRNVNSIGIARELW